MSAQPPKEFRNPLAPRAQPPGLVRDPKTNGGSPNLDAPEFTPQEWATVFNWLAGMNFSGTSEQLHQALAMHDSVMGKLRGFLEGLGLIPPAAGG